MPKRKKSKCAVSSDSSAPDHCVYVIDLDHEVLRHRRFRRANPDYVVGKPCVYVGMTSLTPRDRFDQHKAGYKASRIARRHGRYLKGRRCVTGLTRVEAEEMEVRKARRLRRRGWGVWQN